MAAAAIDFVNGDIFVASERDEKTKRLVTVLFSLLLEENDGKPSSILAKNSESSSSEESLAGDFSESQKKLYDYAQKICESVIFCYIFMRNPHLKVTKRYFSKHNINRKHVFKFVKNYCSVLLKQSPSIHFAVLHSLSFMYHVIEFCLERGHIEFKRCIPLWWEYIFNKNFKEQFYADGHWETFVNYANADFYSEIMDTEFRTRFHLTSATLGCDFSELELSDIDDFPISEESAESSLDEIEVVNPYDVDQTPEKWRHFNTINDTPNVLPTEARESLSTYSTNGNLNSLNNSYTVNLGQKENYNPNIQNLHSKNETC
ncbi:hypothetical protein JTE90_026313 [Oedothorax gibbosus]|uniref:Uncharacterized protein n=1 Tax=Oedothorax gibbosus TaxID=931172 RepID=A0AAV6U6D0_9ARAC|nr:hypothetical protein JTE90_026313 [Oedothorax gibbosus]